VTTRSDAEMLNNDGLNDLEGRLGLAALVCRGGVNFTYLTGLALPGTLGRHLDLTDSLRDVFVVWPFDGAPVVVASELAAAYIEANSRISDVRIYRDYRDRPADVLVSTLKGLDLSGERVGFDKSWFGANRWQEVVEQLPGMMPVDCTRELDLVRAIKSPAEIESLRRAGAVLDHAISDVFSSVKIGETERVVHARIVGRSIELGAASAHGMLQVSSNPVLYGGESDHRILHGDLIRTDYVAYVDGYASNISRLLYAGQPDDKILTSYQKYFAVYKASADLLRAGARAGEVHTRIQTLLANAGFDSGLPLSGHGIGSWFHQQYPLIVDFSSDVLTPGTVVALEPIGGHWHLQDQFLITDGPPERLSDRFDLSYLPHIEEGESALRPER